MGYGLGGAAAAAWNGNSANGGNDNPKRVISVMGDGGFWHNGLASSVGNAVFNKSDNVMLVVDNGYAAATGGQDIPSSHQPHPIRSTQNAIEKAVRGIGVSWARTVNPTYDLKTMMGTLREALTTKAKGPKVIIAQSECMLNRQRRERPMRDKAIKARQARHARSASASMPTHARATTPASACPAVPR